MPTKTQIAQRVADLKRYADAYYNKTPLIEDPEYDALFKELTKWDPDNPFLQQVGSTIIKGTPYTHTTAMLSTEKAYTSEELQNFVNRVTKEAKEVGVTSPTFRVTPKLDGMAGKLEKNILSTRGNGRVGSVVTHVFDLGVVNKGKKNGGVGEIVMSLSYFEKNLQGVFSHPRNVVVGCVNADTIRPEVQEALDDDAVHFMPYYKLPAWTGSGEDLVKEMMQIGIDLAQKVDYPLDGMVAEVVEDAVKDHMGSTEHHNRWQIAIKEEGECAETVIRDIGWQTGRTGVITPVLKVEPKEVDGAVISNITAHHAGMVKSKRLGKGAKITMIRSGFVIPKLKEVLKGVTPTIPTECPRCGTGVEWNNDFILCPNDECPARIETKLQYFFKKIENAKGFGERTISTIVDHGSTTILEIFALKTADFKNMGFGNKQSQNLEEALQTAISTPIEDARFLSAFGLDNFGLGSARKLLAHHKFETLNDLTADDIIAINGFGDTTGPSIATGLSTHWTTIQAIKDLGFSLQATPLESELANVESPIAGKNMLFTGKMVQGNRDDMKRHAKAQGATILSGVSAKIEILVYGPGAAQHKLDSARGFGAQVLTEEEYNALLRGES